jgi:hypothetical protein
LDTANLLEVARLALRSGHRKKARTILMQVIQLDPYSEKGWLWLSGAIDNPDEQRYCLVQVMSINPANQIAIDGLERLGPGSLQSPLEDVTYLAQQGANQVQPFEQGSAETVPTDIPDASDDLRSVSPGVLNTSDSPEKMCLHCKALNPLTFKYCDQCGSKF